MKRRTKIILVVVMLATLFVCFAVSSFAYGGTEIRTDLASATTVYRVNTPRIAIGWNDEPGNVVPTSGGAGHFIDNGTAWHNNRDYYGNGSIAVTNYRDDPDSTYRLPYLYYYYSGSRYDELTYTLPRNYNWVRVHFDVYYSNENSAREYVDLIGNTRNTIVYYNYDVIEYNPETKQSEIRHVEKDFRTDATFIPLRPLWLEENGVCYDLTITTWSAEYNEIRIGTSFDTDEHINEFALRTSEDLFNDHKANYNPAPTFSAFWGGLWGSIDDFLAIELFPDFTLGTVVYIAFAFVALGILLKYFAGG